MAVISGNLADGKPMEVGGWYNGLQWDGSKLGSPGQITVGEYAGTNVSNEVIAQTNPSNVAYIENLKASNIQPSTNLGLPSANTANTSGLQAEADAARRILDETLAAKKAEADKKLADLKAKEQDILTNKVEPLTTPFRADLETAQKEALYVNKNFEANQALTDELDALLTQGNELLKEQQSVTGLASIRNPRIQQTMTDINARAGVIQAVMSARNSQIAQAYTQIDRSVDAITKDRNDQLSYYNTILDLNRKDMLSLDTESKSLAETQLKLLVQDESRAYETADYVKKLMINPDTALLMGQAGVTLSDSIETINSKMSFAQYSNEVKKLSNEMASSGYTAIADPSSVASNQLVTVTDSKGQKYYYQKVKAESTAGGGTEKDIKYAAGQAAASGKTYADMLAFFTKYGMSAVEVYNIYTAQNYYGRPPDNVDPKTGLPKTKPKTKKE